MQLQKLNKYHNFTLILLIHHSANIGESNFQFLAKEGNIRSSFVKFLIQIGYLAIYIYIYHYHPYNSK